MTKKPDVKTAREMRMVLKWVIKYLKMIRDGFCPKRQGRLVISMKIAPPYDVECPPDQEAPPSDICRLLNEMIRALEGIHDQLRKVPVVHPISR